MLFEQVHNNTNVLLLQCISGSRAYGLDTPQSDTDIRGIFYLSRQEFYGLNYTDQVANPSNDIAYYELKKYIELLTRNNPNILELLNTPTDCILYRHPVLDIIKPEIFLSKLCLQTFAGYALTQVKKAGGLNKKIFNPVAEVRKSILEFCYFISGYAAVPLLQWLAQRGFEQADCGLVKIPHTRDTYAIFHKSQLTTGYFDGIYSGENANDVKLSTVPPGIEPLGIVNFNKDSYSGYCKDYKEYWEWVAKRNDARYQNTLQHGKNYDSKNMMHTFRLLNMASEIATEHRVNVKRPDRELLFKVKNGEYEFAELMDMVEQKMELIQQQYAQSTLPDTPDPAQCEALLVEMRERLYGR